MGWHLLETLLQQVGEHSTLVGKLWVTSTFVFRFIVVASVGDAVYSDEQSDFNCNTLQTGCENVCYSLFSPISHLRFWAAQILAVSTPSIVFIVFTAHKLLQVPQDDNQEFDDQALLTPNEELMPIETPQATPSKKRKGGKGGSIRKISSGKPKEVISMVRGFTNPPGEATNYVEEIAESENEDGENANGNENEEKTEEMKEIDRQLALLDSLAPPPNSKEKRAKRAVQAAYATALILRTGTEAVFIWLQITLYGFSVPAVYDCIGYPCPYIVKCFISRPMEKTFLLWFMFAVAIICLTLSIIEIKYLGIKRLKKLCMHMMYSCDDSDDSKNGEKNNNPTDEESQCSNGTGNYLNMDTKVVPSAPSINEPSGLYNVVKYPDDVDDDKKADDSDSIGFNNIGERPSYPIPGYPHVHRYGMILNATPPSVIDKSYL